ncbi:MAG: phosphoribosyltransferase family protein [Parachlamydiaceae bacterium]
MALFKNRFDAGRQLGQLLEKYKDGDVVVYALPRGGIEVAVEIAKHLNAPLDLVFAHKIGHPYQPEYAIAAVSESGHMVGSPYELASMSRVWLEGEKEHQMQEIKRRRKLYLGERKEISVSGQIAIIVDDGVATGLTMQAGIQELKDRHPKKIIVAVPVAPRNTANLLRSLADDLVGIEISDEGGFLGSVGAYYDQFYQVEDTEVIAILKGHQWKK